MKRSLRRLSWLLGAGLLLGAGVLFWMQQEGQPAVGGSGLALESILTQDDAGFASADGAWEYRFPADHGPHPDFRSEVWYLTGNLQDEDGKRYGFALAFFRLRLRPEAIDRASAWGANQVFRAHFALADETRGRFYAEERFSRAALDLSGASESPVRVWLEDWSLDATETHGGQAGFRLHAGGDELDLELELQGDRPPVLLASSGLPEPRAGGGFRVYLMPRIPAIGTLRLGDSVRKVRGDAWLDRAWGAVPVSRGQIALNRFALQLDDGRDILCLQLRRRDGSGTPIPSCQLIGSDGSVKSLRRREIRLEPSGYWRSGLDGTRYPLRWRLELPGEELGLDIGPLLEAQELDFATRAWSGAVEASGRSGAEAVTGRGHLELTGYSPAEDGV